MHHLLQDIGIAIIVATMAGYLAFLLRQPVILAYFLAGIIIGPEIGPRLISDHESIEIISEIGLILLLFVIGLEMNPEKIQSILARLLLPGAGQFLLTTVGAWFLFYAFREILPLQGLELLYLAAGISLSSTAIVIKLLHDKYELDSIAGRLTLGILIFQDIWAILVIVLQPRLENPDGLLILFALLRGAILVAGGLFISRSILRHVFESLTRSPEMVVAVSLGWSAMVSGAAYWIGLSMEMGALIAGISIASFPYSVHVKSRVEPLRDFFLTLFFISLGMKIVLPESRDLIFIPVILFVVLASRFLVLYPLFRLSGSSSRNSFLASLNLSQISEFSLVILSIGLSLGHIGTGFASLMISAMALSAIVSSYLIRYNGQIYRLLARTGPENRSRDGQQSREEMEGKDLFILGYHRGARALVEHLCTNDPETLKRIVVIDYNQEVVRELREQSILCIYGDISHEDTLIHAGLDRARIILSTIPDLLLRGIDNRTLVRICRKQNPEAFIIATADIRSMIHPLKVAGANYVVLPYALLAREIAGICSVNRNPDLETVQGTA